MSRWMCVCVLAIYAQLWQPSFFHVSDAGDRGCFVKARCRAEQKKNVVYTVDVLLNHHCVVVESQSELVLAWGLRHTANMSQWHYMHWPGSRKVLSHRKHVRKYCRLFINLNLTKEAQWRCVICPSARQTSCRNWTTLIQDHHTSENSLDIQITSAPSC